MFFVIRTTWAQNWKFESEEEIEMKELAKLKVVNKSFAFSLQYGYFDLLNNSVISNSESFLQVDDHHGMFNFIFEYYAYENLAFQFKPGFLIIPKEQNINSISFNENGIEASGSGKGGIIFPVTFGAKKTFLNRLVRPYISASAGIVHINIGSGEMSGSILNPETKKDMYKEFSFLWNVGTGIQWRLGKVVRFDLGVNYYGTPNFKENIADIQSFSGMQFFGGMNFILNPK
jgi:hypothetical protein